MDAEPAATAPGDEGPPPAAPEEEGVALPPSVDDEAPAKAGSSSAQGEDDSSRGSKLFLGGLSWETTEGEQPSCGGRSGGECAARRKQKAAGVCAARCAWGEQSAGSARAQGLQFQPGQAPPRHENSTFLSEHKKPWQITRSARR